MLQLKQPEQRPIKLAFIVMVQLVCCINCAVLSHPNSRSVRRNLQSEIEVDESYFDGYRIANLAKGLCAKYKISRLAPASHPAARGPRRANLDPETEAQILDIIAGLKCTRIMIANRPKILEIGYSNNK